MKWDQDKNLRVGHIHMIRDNKALVCPSTYLIHGSFLVFMVDNHYFLGISYLLTIRRLLIPIFPKQRIRVSKNVFPLLYCIPLWISINVFLVLIINDLLIPSGIGVKPTNWGVHGRNKCRWLFVPQQILIDLHSATRWKDRVYNST